MQIKHDIKKHDQLDFEQLTAEIQALFWYSMHYSNNAGIILLSPGVAKKRLNLPNNGYAESLIDRFSEEYPFFIKGNYDHLYILTSKIVDQHTLPLNTNYTRHIGVLKDIHESHASFKGVVAYEAFFEEHIKESYDHYLAEKREGINTLNTNQL